jgi:hypothetical protein
MHREILRFAQNDKRTFSAASLAAGLLGIELAHRFFQPVGFVFDPNKIKRQNQTG